MAEGNRATFDHARRSALALLAIDVLPIGVAAQDASGTVVFVNRSGAERFGLSPADFEDRPVAEFLAPSGRAMLLDQLERRRRNLTDPYEIEWQLPKGPVATVVFPAMLRDANGGLAGSVGVLLPTGPLSAIVAERLAGSLAPAVSALASALTSLRLIVGNSAESRDASGETDFGTRLAEFDVDGRRELTAREHELLGLALQGLNAARMARSLGISPETVRNHLKSIYRKTGVHSRIELIARSALCRARDAAKG